MKLVSFDDYRIGVLTDRGVVDITGVLPDVPDALKCFRMLVLIEDWETLKPQVEQTAASRVRVGDAVDHGVGVIVLAKPGDEVRDNQPLLELHHRDGRGLDQAVALCRSAVAIGDTPPETKSLGEVG